MDFHSSCLAFIRYIPLCFLHLVKEQKALSLGRVGREFVFVPVILLLPNVWGINGILYAQPIADVISGIITIFMALQLHGELTEAEAQLHIEKQE